MKNNALTVFMAVITGTGLFGFGVSIAIAQSKDKPQEITKVDNYDICSGHIPGRPEDKTADIILCKDSQGNLIYEVSHAAKDAGQAYFDSNKNFIADCGMDAKDPYPGKCSDILKYHCDRTKNLRIELCAKENAQSYIACGCGCCGGVEPAQECLYHSKGDDIGKIMEADNAQRQSPICKFAGCARGVKYAYCD